MIEQQLRGPVSEAFPYLEFYCIKILLELLSVISVLLYKFFDINVYKHLTLSIRDENVATRIDKWNNAITQN